VKPAAIFLCLIVSGITLVPAQETGGTVTANEDYDDQPSEPDSPPPETDDYIIDDYIVMEDEEGLTITGTTETNQQMRRVDREAIEKIHAPDLPSLLETALGLGTTRYGPSGSQSNINIRGFDTERIAVLIDGIPVNDPSSGDFDFSRIDPDSVESIEVIYGGSDTKYNVSGALGGVINIITVKKHKKGLRAGGSVSNTSALPGTYHNWKNRRSDPRWEDLADTQKISLFANQGFERFSWSLSLFGSRAGNHFLFTDDYDTVRRKEGNEILDGGAQISLVRDIGDYSKVIFAGDIYYGDKKFPIAPNTNIAADQTGFSSRQNVMLDMPRAFHDDLAMEASLSHYGQGLEYQEPGVPRSTHDQDSFTLINRWSWYPRPELTFRFGGDYRFVTMDSSDMGNHSRGDGGTYATLEYQFFPELLVMPSVKIAAAGRPDLSPLIVPVPKLGLVWKPLENLTVKNNYFRSFKLPDLEDLYWNSGGYSGNPGLESEDGWGADIGAAYRFPKWLELESAFFAQWTRDSIHWSMEGGNWRPENAGEAAFFGVDSRLTGTFPFAEGFFTKTSCSLSYQYLRSFLLSSGYDFSSEKRIPYMSEHTLGISGELFWKSGSFLAAGRYESSRYTDMANASLLPGRFLVDLTANQQINDRLTAFAAIRNLFNTSYQSFKDYPMPGITLTIGLKAAFEFSPMEKEKGEVYE
jgi:vitamin B12 transporter